MESTQGTQAAELGFDALFKESGDAAEFREGSELEAVIESIERDHVIIDAGLKSESYVPIDEFKNEEAELEVKVGDRVRVRIELTDNGKGQTVLSRMQVKRREAWERIKDAYESEAPIPGVIKDRVKSGFIVSIDGFRAFLPGSQVDVVPSKDPGAFLGLRSDFKVIKMESGRGGVVVSRRMVQEGQRMGKGREEALGRLEEGQVVKGTVTSIIDYGAFVDIGEGLYGLLHITDMAWRRVRNVTDIVTAGQEIEVKILAIDMEKGRLSFGLKQLQQDPWEYIDRVYTAGDRIVGKVSNIADYGAFVELQEGIDGLVHTSEMDWSRKNVDPKEIVTVGEEVEVQILDIDKEKRRISLGIKQCRGNPWQDFNTAYRAGSVVTGKVKSITDFGMFVGLPGGLQGLVRLSDLSYTESGESAVRNYSRGQEIEVIVLNIDIASEKIGLGIKQLDDGAFNRYVGENLKGTVVTGEVVSVSPEQAEVRLADEITGVLPAREASESGRESVAGVVGVGEKVELMLVDIDRRNHVLTLSAKARDRAERERAMRAMREAPESSAPALGALIQAKLDENRRDEEEKEGKGDAPAPPAGEEGKD